MEDSYKMEDYFKIGKIIGAHGIKGVVKVFPLTDDITRFFRLKSAVLLLGGRFVPYEIERIWVHKQFVMLALAGVPDRTAAQTLQGVEIVVDAKDAIPLGPDEYFIRDLIGLGVFTEDGEHLGAVADVLVTGANDVYVVKKEGARDLLLPGIKQCIIAVDVAHQKMLVRLPAGLRDV